jgi:hypothetical protein
LVLAVVTLVYYLYTPARKQVNPTSAELDELHKWLWENPPDGTNRPQRRRKMATIQSLCSGLDPLTFADYHTSWYKESWLKSHGMVDQMWGPRRTAAEFESSHPVLYYLRKATAHAMQDIRSTTVTKGLVVWHLYNMGYVFKTPEKCFAIDIYAPDPEQLAEELDFLLFTHTHHDHTWWPLLEAMVDANKPVITRGVPRWCPCKTIVDKPSEFRLGGVRVKVDIGDHCWWNPSRHNDMLMFQVDCGKLANNCTIYHSGDGSNFRKMRPDRPVDIFIVACDNGMSTRRAARHLKPRLIFVSHLLELGHSPTLGPAELSGKYAFKLIKKQPGRLPFDYAFRHLGNTPQREAVVLTWGERWLLPGTILEKQTLPQN